MISIYLIIAYSLNLVFGTGGLLLLCSSAFYGLGAYLYAILSTTLKLPLLQSVTITMLYVTVIAVILGILAVKFRGDGFVLVTLGFQLIIYTVLYNCISWTNGPYGIERIKSLSINGFVFNSVSSFLPLVSSFALLVFFIFKQIDHSNYGLVLKATRNDFVAVESLGIDSKKILMISFVISSWFLSFAGIFYASHMSFIDPTSFNLDESIFQISILLIGGTGNLKGPLVGTIVLLLIPEILRFIGLPNSIAANLRQIIYGFSLLLVIFLRPKGIVGNNGLG